MLSQDGFEKAKGFILTQARPLEQALFAFHFENGSQETVLDALAGFQNADGGFGHALEPDIRLPDSSPMVTTVGFQVMRDVGVSGDQEMVQRGVRFLLDTYDADLGRWPQVPSSVDDYPHAPWWTFNAEDAKKEGFRPNASAEIVGHFWHYRELVPDDFLKEITQTALSHLDASQVDMEMHDALCYLWLLEIEDLPDLDKVKQKMVAVGSEIVARDPEQWSGYGLRPLTLAPLPTSPLADVLKDVIQVNLDYEIEHQGDDGAWHPAWSWGSDGWEEAERDWKGVLTGKMLRSLKGFGRV